MAARLRVAVVGAGRMGRRHAENLVACPGAAVDWIIDPDPAVAGFAERLGARWSAGMEPLSASDAVVIACPTALHPAAVDAALAAGSALFCEKPLALGLPATAALAARIAASRAYFQMGFMRRYDPGYAEVWRVVRAGGVGRPRHFLAVSRDPAPPPESYVRVSGGIFLDLGIHDVDILRWLAGEEVVEVYAQGNVGNTAYLARHEDVEEGQALIRFASGALGTLLLSRTSLYGYDVRAEVWGTAGSVAVGPFGDGGVVRGDGAGLHAPGVPGFLERFAAAYRLEMADFVARVRDGRPAPTTEADGVAAAAVADACQRSLRAGQPVAVAPPG